MMTGRDEPGVRQPDEASLDRDLALLETGLRQLENDYTMFFAGRRQRPPVELRARVEAIIRHWDRVSIQQSTERFRFSTLQLRFRSYANLWDRGQRAREEGRPWPFSTGR
jgi:hypothetical protein